MLARVREVAACLPATLSSWLYLECRLGGAARQVDLIVNVESAGRDILAGLNPTLRLDHSLTSDGAWGRVLALARRWADTRSGLDELLDGVWLEFDVPETASRTAYAPSVFLDFREWCYSEGSAADRCARAEVALRSLRGRPLDEGTAERVRRCFHHLPDGVFVLYAGTMLARNDDRVRLCVIGLAADELGPYLQAVGWPGSLDGLKQLLAPSGEETGVPTPNPTIVHLDVGARVGARVGLEYAFARVPQLRGELPDPGIVTPLARCGMVAAEKRAALARWPGFTRETMPHELWPSLVVRRVNHVKVVYAAGSAPEVKAYLSMDHRFAGGAVTAEQ